MQCYRCMRRLQANLAYLASIADRAHKPSAQTPAHPAILEPPPKLPSLTESYKKLKELFPEAKTQAGVGKPGHGQQKPSMSATMGQNQIQQPITSGMTQGGMAAPTIQ